MSKSETISNRVLNRRGARELEPREQQYVAGGTTTGCFSTTIHENGRTILDFGCDPNFPV